MRKRERKRKANLPVKSGIDTIKLGQEFEWTDPKLKVGLEAHPSWKRPISNARIDMMLALNLYFDDITQKWQPLDNLTIATVQNQGRFYPIPPSALTVDQWENLRIDKNRRLLTVDKRNAYVELPQIETSDIVGATTVNYDYNDLERVVAGVDLTIRVEGAGNLSYTVLVESSLGNMHTFATAVIAAPAVQFIRHRFPVNTRVRITYVVSAGVTVRHKSAFVTFSYHNTV